MTRLAPTSLLLLAAGTLTAADWPQWGRDTTHNAVSPEANAPLDFAFPTEEDEKRTPGRNIAWRAELGSMTVTPPVVADGLVWVGTNAREPADDKIPAKEWDGGVLMCFREADGKLLWNHRTPRLTTSFVNDFPRSALGSCPLVEGDRLWYVNTRNEVVCLDVGPLKRGTGLPTEVWKLDTIKQLGVFPHRPLMQGGFGASVAGYKDRLYVVTHNGVDEGHITVPAPNAPSLVCLEKATGKVVWSDNSPGKNILKCQISSPLVAEVSSRALVIVGQGDGWLRAFDTATGKLVWKCDLNPKDSVYDLGGTRTRNYVVATPVLYDGRVYVAPGQNVEHAGGIGCLYCIDPARDGDVSLDLDAGPKKPGKPNPNSAVVWHTRGPIPADVPGILVGKNKWDRLRDREYLFGRAIAGCTIHDGLLYAADVEGYFFCFDARTGKVYWVEDLKGMVCGQPLWADGKVYAVTDGELFVFAHGKQKKLLRRVEVDGWVRPGPVFANGILYITTHNILYAIRSPK
jgi:outer membrane protein assembly factor BamB